MQDSPERQRASAEIQRVADELYERFGKQCLNVLRTKIVRQGGNLAGVRVGQSNGTDVDSQSLNSVFNQAWGEFPGEIVVALKLESTAVGYLIKVVNNTHLEGERRKRRDLPGMTGNDTSAVEQAPHHSARLSP